MIPLDAEEKEVLESFERGEWQSTGNIEEKRAEFQAYAQNFLNEHKEILVKLSEQDYDVLQTRALEEGLPLSALVSSILHRYASKQMPISNRNID